MISARELLQKSLDGLKKEPNRMAMDSQIPKIFISEPGGPTRLCTSPQELTSPDSTCVMKPPSEEKPRFNTKTIMADDEPVNQEPLALKGIGLQFRPSYAGVLSRQLTIAEADQSLRETGPAPQPLRAFPAFPGQRAPPNQNTPLSAGRLQTTKLGDFYNAYLAEAG